MIVDPFVERVNDGWPVVVGPLVVLPFHRVRRSPCTVEDAGEFVVLVQRIEQFTVDDSGSEVPRTAELVSEVRSVVVEKADCFTQQPEECRLHLAEGEVPAAVQVGDCIQFDVTQWFAVVRIVARDDVSVQPAVVTLGLTARVVDARSDRAESDRPTHQLPRVSVEATEEVEDNAAVVGLFETASLRMIPVFEIALVDLLLSEVRVRLTWMAGRSTPVLDDAFHPVAEPARQRKRGNDAADLVLRIVGLVIRVRRVVAIGQNRVSNDQQITLETDVDVRTLLDRYVGTHGAHPSAGGLNARSASSVRHSRGLRGVGSVIVPRRPPTSSSVVPSVGDRIRLGAQP